MAAKVIGYSDNPCTATAGTPSLYTSELGNGIYDINLSIEYTLVCRDGTTRKESGFARVYYSEWAGSNRRTGSPPPYYLPGPPSSVSYIQSSNQFRFNGNRDSGIPAGSPYSVYVNDPLYAAIEFRGYARASSSGASSTEIWRTKADASAGLQKLPKYNPNDLSTQVLFNRIQPDNTFAPIYPFNLTNEDASSRVPRALMKISMLNDPRYFGVVYLLPGAGDRDYFGKPVVVCDAFDPSNQRRALDIYENPRYNRLFSMTSPTSPRTQGYDMFFIDFSQGGGNILLNAAIVLKFVQWLGTQTPNKALIGGPSMGGQIVRLALLYSLPENNTAQQDLATNIKGMMAIDSPNQGASIGGTIQKATYSISTDGDVNTAVGFNNMTPLENQENSATDQWNQLCQPAAYQMLYEHYYPNIDAIDPDARIGFYNFLKSLGAAAANGDPRGYRKDIPKVSIAYSNFHVPHAAVSINDYAVIGEIKVSVGGVELAQRSFRAGGPVGSSSRYDLLPGSTGNWYYSSYGRKTPKFVYPSTRNGEIFKGTFVTLASALDLENFDLLSPPTTNPLALARYSPFNKVYYMANDYNGYSSSTSIDDRRYEHIIFDEQIMNAVSRGLEDLKKGVGRAPLAPILSLMLD